MKKNLNISLIGAIGLKLQMKGEKVDESGNHNGMYVAHSTNLLDDDTIQSELDNYVKNNNIDAFKAEDLNTITDYIFEKHILNITSDHTTKNKSEVMRRS